MKRIFKSRIARLVLLAGFMLCQACTITFGVTTQRTALENQVMGAYKELEDDLVLMSSVRAPKDQASVSAYRQRALDARQNQDFNRDDVDELKTQGILGEASDGTIALLPKSVAASAVPQEVDLASTLVREENRDREAIWQRIIESNRNLSAKDLPEVRKTYAKMQRESAVAGHWVQDDAGVWIKR